MTNEQTRNFPNLTVREVARHHTRANQLGNLFFSGPAAGQSVGIGTHTGECEHTQCKCVIISVRRYTRAESIESLNRHSNATTPRRDCLMPTKMAGLVAGVAGHPVFRSVLAKPLSETPSPGPQ